MGNLFSFLEIQNDEKITLTRLDTVLGTNQHQDEENGLEPLPEEEEEDDDALQVQALQAPQEAPQEAPPPPPLLKREESEIFKTPRNTEIISKINNNHISNFDQLPDCQGSSSVYYGKGINVQGENVYFLSYRAKIYDDIPETADEIIARGGNNLNILNGPLDPDEYKPYNFNFTAKDFLDL